MKYFSILFAVLWGISISQAQITITSNDLPAAGESYTFKTVGFPFGNLDITTTGPNQMWDYSNLVGDSVVQVDYVASSQTPYGFYFFNRFGTQIADTQSLAQGYALTDVYLFFKKDAGAYIGEGLGLKISQIPLPLAGFYTDKDTIYNLPLTYGNADTSTYRFYLGVPTLGSYSQTGTRITTVDGWGSIKTPSGTYNCLRVVAETDQVDSLVIQAQGGFGFPIRQRSIQWLTDQDKVPVLEITQAYTLNQWTTTGVRYRDQTTGITSAEAPAFTVFPNPASDQIQVRWEMESALNEIRVVDIMGRTVHQERTINIAHSISTSNWSEGVYFVSVLIDDDWHTQSFTINR